ncbi:aminotransferase family protein [Clostridium sp. Cult1]|uniref:aminotransferase family protein n=1 Tax=Clostridium sp. Cult1 TaxID=2079002 RepID=UPI001F45FF70|nr:aspartate aminotransferase family protein [Clostridium sp. Cult1]MCF6462790.1 aspartate aminotransferase family protein [Clostridium sp. Cult1]
MGEIQRKALEHLWQFGASRKKVLDSGGPIVFEKGEGCYLIDVDGKRYIDGLSGAWVVNSGHRQPDIIKGIVNQYDDLEYALSSEGFTNTKAIELAEKLSVILPGHMDRVYFTCGGSEAVEIALRFARIYHKMTGNRKKDKIIARHGSYHGSTLFALSVSGYDIISKSFGPTPEGIVKTTHPYCYRCEYEPDRCGYICADDLEKIILENGAETVAAFIAEPISANSGVAIPPKEYWQKIRSICDKYNVLLIIDEVLTGFGRTGKLFGIENFQVEPDIITMSKGLTSGYAPLGAVAMKKSISNRIPDNAFLPQGFTYSGHPVSCAAALANIKFMIDHKLPENAKAMGNLLIDGINKRLDGNPYIGDIRGIGLLICIEIDSSKMNREVQNFLSEYFLKKGLYTRVIKEYIHIAPPLIINSNEVEKIIHIVVSGIEELSKKYQ